MNGLARTLTARRQSQAKTGTTGGDAVNLSPKFPAVRVAEHGRSTVDCVPGFRS